MGFIQNIKQSLLDKRLERLRGDLKMIIENGYEYNPYHALLPAELTNKSIITEEIVENLCWYVGNAEALREYFTKMVDANNAKIKTYKVYNQYFWGQKTLRKIHSGIPALISNKMATILFGAGINIDATIYNEDGSKNEKESSRAKELIDLVLKEIHLNEKLITAAEIESWCGHVAFKLSHDISLSSLPIIEVFDRRNFEIIKPRGITQGIIFKYYYKVKGKDYILEETYSTDSEGKAIVEENLYEFDGQKKKIVALTEIPQTKDLLPINTLDIDGATALEKPNLIRVKQFVDNPYGSSDYNTSSSTFDGCDETFTALCQEIRDNRTFRYIPSEMLEKDENGNTKPLDPYMTNFVITREDADYVRNGGSVGIKTESADDKTDSNFIKFKTYLVQACAQVGLSPISLGITGLESISSSDKSTRERNKTTIETRNKKIQLWKPFLESLILQIMSYTSLLQKEFPDSVKKGIPVVDIDYSNCDISVSFNDYISNSIEEKIATWSQAKTSRIASTEMIINRLYGDDLTEAQRLDEINRIKFEEGIALDTPDALSLTGEDNTNA